MKKNYTWLLGMSILLTNFCHSQVTVTLQPNAQNGKDANISSRYPSLNMGNTPDFAPLAWTNGGVPDTYRSLIQFDLSSIPVGASVNNATLYLYHDPLSLNTDAQHKPLSGSNAAVLRKLTSSWDEMTVTWDTQPSFSAVNQVNLSQSQNATQDYVINMTALIQDAVNDPSSYYGYIIRLQTEQYYRSLIFASSDNSDVSNHPKLVVNYNSNLGIDENLTETKVDVYPNPCSNGWLNIRTDKASSLEITDFTGKIVLSLNELQNNEYKIDVQHLVAGTYFMHFENESMTSVKKIIIE